IFLSGRFNKSGCTPDNMMSLLGQSSCKPLCRNIGTPEGTIDRITDDGDMKLFHGGDNIYLVMQI
ncbi:MAG: hypothetical protein CO170_01795, partial [candidate division SR1 bacterium CG_4_9_14_3_um_filter_40_9]